MKPSVKHFKVFGCLAFVHIPDVQRKKLDSKSIECVHLGVSEESKAYKLYSPIDKKIIISRDVVFDESKGWNWGESSKVQEAHYEVDDGEAFVNNETEEEPANDVNNEENHEEAVVQDSESEELYESEEEL
ncbi:hypothetical protein A2U01_0046631 [Trifolium medium]|uniref:Retroviral polymerase SH3-like domain-containing protein n=1 Tax=Trifolium medium TaxID=97028 RepID=A0A392QP61_9FABA|nr:hypothetical protein [Trifolium medium]